MSKDTQLTWYLNIIEFGDSTYGIEEAARFYFKKNAQSLTPSQCLALAAIIPSPKKWNKSLIKKNFTPFFKRRYRTILNNIKDLENADKKEILLAERMYLWQNQKDIINDIPSESLEHKNNTNNSAQVEDEDET